MTIHLPIINLRLDTPLPTPNYAPELEQPSSLQNRIFLPSPELLFQRHISALNRQFHSSPSIVSKADPLTFSKVDPSTFFKTDPSTFFKTDPSTVSRVDPSTVSKTARFVFALLLIVALWMVTARVVHCFAKKFNFVSRFKTAISLSCTTAITILTCVSPPIGIVVIGILLLGLIIREERRGPRCSREELRHFDDLMRNLANKNRLPLPVLQIDWNLMLPFQPIAAQPPNVPLQHRQMS